MPGALALALALKTAMAPANLPMPGSSFDINFAGGAYWPAGPSTLIGTTRVAPGWAVNSSGLLVPFAANTSRITDVGDTIESARTNLFLRSDDISNVAWQSGGANPTIVSTNNTAPDGSLTATRLTLATGSAAATRQVVTVTNSQPVMINVYVKLAPSNAATNFRICTNNTGAWNQGGDAVIALTSSWQRAALTYSNTFGTSVAAYFGAQKSDSTEDATCKGDVLLWGADFNANVSTSQTHITTTTATVTRDADVAVVPVGNTTRIVFTFSDGTTQTVTGVTPSSNYTIPTNLNKPVIARMTGYPT